MKIKCITCGYSWEYKGNMIKATCPNCSYKTRTKLFNLSKSKESTKLLMGALDE